MQLPGKYVRLRYFDKRLEKHVYQCAVEVAVARLGIEELKDKQKDSIESVARGHRRSLASGNGLRRPAYQVCMENFKFSLYATTTRSCLFSFDTLVAI